MFFVATKSRVSNQGVPPDEFLNALVTFGKSAPDEIFAPNAVPVDIFTSVKSRLATLVGKDGSGTPVYHWESLSQRKGAMLESLRVIAGEESTWRWNLGVDTGNEHSLSHITGQETGAFQVSYDSLPFDHSLRECLVRYGVAVSPLTFIRAMKSNHQLAIEYCARLIRFTINHQGTIRNHEIHPSLSRQSAAEFERLIAPVA